MPFDVYHYVYILASKRNGTLYVGYTRNLIKRVYEHKNDIVKGFTNKYQVHILVYFEQFEDKEQALKKNCLKNGKENGNWSLLKSLIRNGKIYMMK